MTGILEYRKEEKPSVLGWVYLLDTQWKGSSHWLLKWVPHIGAQLPFHSL